MVSQVSCFFFPAPAELNCAARTAVAGFFSGNVMLVLCLFCIASSTIRLKGSDVVSFLLVSGELVESIL